MEVSAPHTFTHVLGIYTAYSTALIKQNIHIKFDKVFQLYMLFNKTISVKVTILFAVFK